MNDFFSHVEERYEQGRHDIEYPLIEPASLYMDETAVVEHFQPFTQVFLHHHSCDGHDFPLQPLPELTMNPRAGDKALPFVQFIDTFHGRILITAESTGRRETLLDSLREIHRKPTPCQKWSDFLGSEQPLNIVVAPLQEGLVMADMAIVTEQQLLDSYARQERRRKRSTSSESIIRNLTDLEIGAPVVHMHHGVGRYAGLEHQQEGDIDGEFVILDYADAGRLFVPVSSLHLLSRYTGASVNNAPWHKLGSEQWSRARQKAAQKAIDTAAELLDLYARRAAHDGQQLKVAQKDYDQFVSAFPFEETPDQNDAFAAVMTDMTKPTPMDRLVCGDVGFGKTEVAMRAAFLAVNDNRQVALLVPTTLLAQQHYQNFLDRFAEWPIRIGSLSRFKTAKEQKQTLEQLADGRMDIVIGTHKLISGNIGFKNLGLIIIDEEQRFGVRQKEQLRKLRSEVDTLTLTATPIPRTLNMAFAGIRDLSIIATPPTGRMAVKTFVGEWKKAMVMEACLRELKRGGQVYFLHNEISTIQQRAKELKEWLPMASIGIGHGQMPEKQLEKVMLDFYHRRCNILVCTTIVESGIDIPNANTIIIERADKMGLSQLHQLRGRVGRSHHRAFAYLFVPSKRTMTKDARKRIEAIASLEDLGAGFMLANHDLEIRGAGELLGDEQSGQIQEIGFSLYMELLERAVKAIKSGKTPSPDMSLETTIPEIDLRCSALIPNDYLPDVQLRLVLYKRIAGATDDNELKALQVEMIDRFGLLPDSVTMLFQLTRLKLLAEKLGISRIRLSNGGGTLTFRENPDIDVPGLLTLIQSKPSLYQLEGLQRLRIIRSLPTEQDRIKAVEQLLEQITPETSKESSE